MLRSAGRRRTRPAGARAVCGRSTHLAARRATNRFVIVVVGESLVDLVVADDGRVDAALGGAPFNTARAASRLGADVELVATLSDDRFGALLTERLVDDGVRIDHVERTEAPTTLAAAEIDEDGSASYRFYFDGTSAPLLSSASVRDATAAATAGGGGIFFTGGLGLVLEPMATAITAGLASIDDAALVVVDVNCRPAVVHDRAAYLTRIEQVVGRADLVKVSDEDLAFLSPGLAPGDAARRLLEFGAAGVIVTAGGSHTTVLFADRIETIDVPPVTAPVVDTIGAGDTFGGGLLAWLAAAGVRRDTLSLDDLRDGVRVGHAAAGIVVTRRGADPPWRTELDIVWP